MRVGFFVDWVCKGFGQLFARQNDNHVSFQVLPDLWYNEREEGNFHHLERADGLYMSHNWSLLFPIRATVSRRRHNCGLTRCRKNFGEGRCYSLFLDRPQLILCNNKMNHTTDCQNLDYPQSALYTGQVNENISRSCLRILTMTSWRNLVLNAHSYIHGDHRRRRRDIVANWSHHHNTCITDQRCASFRFIVIWRCTWPDPEAE